MLVQFQEQSLQRRGGPARSQPLQLGEDGVQRRSGIIHASDDLGEVGTLTGQEFRQNTFHIQIQQVGKRMNLRRQAVLGVNQLTHRHRRAANRAKQISNPRAEMGFSMNSSAPASSARSRFTMRSCPDSIKTGSRSSLGWP